MARLVVMVAALVGTSIVALADWPIFRGTVDCLGVAQANLPDQLVELWTFKSGNAIEGTPAIVGSSVYFGSADKHAYAVDLKTGQQKWKVPLGSSISAAAAVRGERLYLGTNDGKLVCMNTKDGSKIWEFTVEGGITSGVTFHKNNILLGSRDIPLLCISDEGKKVWEFPIDGGANGTPSVVGDRTFVAGCDSLFHVIDANTGKEISQVPLDGQAAAAVPVVGTQAFIGTMTNQVLAVDFQASKKLWSFEATRRAQPFYASPAVTEKLIIAGSRDKKVYALDRLSGAERWSFTTDGQVDGSPVVVGERVYVGCLSNDGNFYVLDLKTGRKIQELNLDSAVTSSPAVGGDCVLVGSDKGTLYCFGKR